MHNNRVWHLAAKKMAGEATVEEIRELESLLKQDPDMHYALQNINDLWQLPVKPPVSDEKLFERHLERMEAAGVPWEQTPTDDGSFELSGPVRSRNRVRVIGISSVFVILTLITLWYSGVFQKNPDPVGEALVPAKKNEISTRNGWRSIITLPDGSKVRLNAGSKLGYGNDFGKGSRNVELSGEAFFDVVHNADIPFIIKTPEVEIRVLGTTFNVKSYPGEGETETSLVKGTVEVSIPNRPDKKFILKPNEKLIVKVDESEASPLSAARDQPIKTATPLVTLSTLRNSKIDRSLMMETAWVENKLVFENETFDVLASRMERWYGVSFHFRNELLTHLRFSGKFEGETIQQAMEALSITAGGFHFRIQNNTVEIFK